MFKTCHHIPDGLLETPATGLLDLLGAPSLIHLDGTREQRLFISVLLHGNEDTGYEAVRALLRKYQGQTLPRAMSIFIGNVLAARHGQRRLDGQPDYNRIWPGGDEAPSPERDMMQAVWEDMRQRPLFASIDLHNNTGLNPHYGCVNRLDDRFLHLATLFSRTVVYFLRPRGVQSLAFADLCPAVTLECGKAGQPHGTEHTLEFLDACLHLADFPSHPVAAQDIDLFHTVATVRVRADSRFSFDEQDVPLRFVGDLDHLNFRELPRGTLIGWCHDRNLNHLEVISESGENVTPRYFYLEGDEIRTHAPVMPSMLTMNAQVIRQDCLCYLMERWND